MNSPEFSEWLNTQLVETAKSALAVVSHFVVYTLILVCFAAGSWIKHKLLNGRNQPALLRPKRKLRVSSKRGSKGRTNVPKGNSSKSNTPSA